MSNIDPVIITGVPRSGTSLAASIINELGCRIVADQIGLTQARHGYGESSEIRDGIIKNALEAHGVDRMGQKDIVFEERIIIDVDIKDKVLAAAHRAGVDTTKPWGFKGCKTLLMYESFDRAFPEAKWVVVDRERQAHIRSLETTPFMRHTAPFNNWGDWISNYFKYTSLLPVGRKWHFDPCHAANASLFDLYLEELAGYVGGKRTHNVRDLIDYGRIGRSLTGGVQAV